MNATATTYQRIRKATPTMSAKHAISIARTMNDESNPLGLDGTYLPYGKFEVDGFDVRVECSYDEWGGNDEFYGRFVDSVDDRDATVDNPNHRYDRHSYKFYESCYPLTERRETYGGRWHGMSRGVADAMARKDLRNEATRMGSDGGMQAVNIEVIVSRHGVELGRDSLGAVEIDDVNGYGMNYELASAWSTIKDYDMVGNAIAEAQATLERLLQPA